MGHKRNQDLMNTCKSPKGNSHIHFSTVLLSLEKKCCIQPVKYNKNDSIVSTLYRRMS